MATYDVTEGKTHCGVIFDEEGAIPTRGRFAAWSMKAKPREGKRNNGIVGFYDTLEEATAAIEALYAPEPPVFEPEDTYEMCTSVLGGDIHTALMADTNHPFPLCRTMGQNSRGTRYRLVDHAKADLTCSNCIRYRAYRNRVRAEAEAAAMQ